MREEDYEKRLESEKKLRGVSALDASLSLPPQKSLTEKLTPRMPTPKNLTIKPWGQETILAKTSTYVVKEIRVKAGHRLSEQFHEKKNETMFLVSGQAYLQIGNESFNMVRLSPIHIPPKTIHRLEAVGDCVIVEVSSTELSDVVRTQDDYGR